MATIAREAGVSVPTVSKVLNGWSEVAPETRERVERLLRERGYVRRRGDRAGGAHSMVEVVIDSLDNSWAAAVLAGVESACHERHLGVAITVARPLTGRRTGDWVDTVIARGSRGVIAALVELSTTQIRKLQRAQIPCVMVDPVATPDDSVFSVGATNWAGGRRATEHLIELGHRRIGVVVGPEDLLCNRARVAGYRAAMDRAGLVIAEGYVRSGPDFSTYTGRDLTTAMLDLPEPPTALFICADTLALGAYRALDERGLRIPDDLSIVGFDDRPESHWVSPRLTTVRQPVEEMAVAALELLDQLIRDRPPVAHRVELATMLLERESTGVPRAD
jgi:DNA-binding LacI/PurR family transcriptional regulator